MASRSPIDKAIAKLSDDLNWRGPGGRPMGNVVIERVDAGVILDALTKPRILPPLKTTPKALRDLAAMLARYDDSDTATALRWAADDIEALQSS
jgi:hypothetical protein